MDAMEVAHQFQAAAADVKRLKKELGDAQRELTLLESQMVDLIAEGRLPESFRLNGKPIYTREEIWASPLDGDHERLTAALRNLGLTEYLPRNVNSQSISAYVREFKDPETGELVGLPEELAAALKITKRPRVVAAGLS